MSNRLRKFTEEREQGFTLIELLVVIIIIGILAAIAIPVFLNQRKKGVDASLKSDIKSMATAQETWLTDNTATLTGKAITATAAGGTADVNGTADFKASPGNVVSVTLQPTTGGYCIKAFNTGASTAITLATAVTYDSSKGGFVANGTACSA